MAVDAPTHKYKILFYLLRCTECLSLHT